MHQKRFSWVTSYLIVSTVFTVLLSSLYFFNLNEWPTNLISWLFIVIYSIGHFGLLLMLSFVPIYIFIRLKKIEYVLRMILPLGIGFFQFYLIIDSFVFSQYRFHINSMVFDLFINGQGQVLQFEKVVWIWSFGIFVAVTSINYVVSEFLFKKWILVTEVKKSPLHLFSGFVVMAFLVSHWIHAEADARSYYPITHLASFYPLSAPARFDGTKLDSQTVTVRQFKNFELSEVDNQWNCPQTQNKFNLLIILVNSMRADILTEEIMPNLFRFSQDHIVFQNHFSGSNETRGGVFSLFYGMPPFYFESEREKRQSSPIIAQAQAAEFDMGIFASAPLTKPEFDQTVFSSIKNLRKDSESSSPSIRDQEITQKWMDFIDNKFTLKSNITIKPKNNPFFGFLFYDSLHAYDFPMEYHKKFEPLWNGINYFELNQNFNPAPFVNRYKTSAHYVDSLIGSVLNQLTKSDLFKNTVIVITSDHGQEFNDSKKNYWGHNSNFSPYQTKVPLIVAWPKMKSEVISHRTTHYDIPVTLMRRFYSCKSKVKNYSWGYDLFKDQPRNGTLMGYPNKFGILLKDKVISSEFLGSFEVFDFNYNKTTATPEDYKILNNTLSKLSSHNQNKSHELN